MSFHEFENNSLKFLHGFCGRGVSCGVWEKGFGAWVGMRSGAVHMLANRIRARGIFVLGKKWHNYSKYYRVLLQTLSKCLVLW